MYIAVLPVINVTPAKHLQKYLIPGKSCPSVNANGAFSKRFFEMCKCRPSCSGPCATQTFQNNLASIFRYCQPPKLWRAAGEQIFVAQK